jgi:hypothetical protein
VALLDQAAGEAETSVASSACGTELLVLLLGVHIATRAELVIAPLETLVELLASGFFGVPDAVAVGGDRGVRMDRKRTGCLGSRVAAAKTPELAATWAAVIVGFWTVRFQLSDERASVAVAVQAKLRGDLPHRRIHAPAKDVALAEDPVVLWHGWILGDVVQDERGRALFVLLGNAVSDRVEICADTLLPTRAKSKRSTMQSSHYGLGLANCDGCAGLEPHSSQMGAGAFAVLKSGVFAVLESGVVAMLGSGVCAVLRSGVFSMMGECVNR